MIAYASRTGTARQLDAFRLAGWRILVSARGVLRTEGFPYALDNGAWTSYTQGESFDDAAFVRAVDLLGADADWVVAPDVVGGSLDSLALSTRWLPWLLARTPRVLIPVQNGMDAGDVVGLLSPRVGIFVGGDDLAPRPPTKPRPVLTWKERTAPYWAALARANGAYCHVGRVNTRARLRICAAAGVDSFDGTSGSRFAVNVPKIDAWRRQPSILAPRSRDV